MLLEIDGIECSYDHVPALTDVTLRVEGGESLGIIGPNGSGKTTLLRAISRTLKPRRGVVTLDGRDVWEMREREVARQIGVVPQTTQISFAFTAHEIVLMGRTPRLDRFAVVSEEDVRVVKESMMLADCWEFRNRLFSELSGGEQQRVVIARALAQEPKILLLDEPTSHLDIGYQLEIMGLINKLKRLKRLVVISVFHDLNLAARFCDKFVLLHSGRVHAMGPATAVMTPENIRTVYGVEAVVETDRWTGKLRVNAIAPSRESARGKRVEGK